MSANQNPQRQIHYAQTETPNFSFEAYGATESEAVLALEAGLRAHGAQHGLEPDWYASFAWNCRALDLGQPYRDREPLALTEVNRSEIPRYVREFPEFGLLDVEIPAGFEDISWHNDVCPSFRKVMFNGQSLRLWVDAKYPADREYAEWQRFSLRVYDQDDNPVTTLVESNDIAEVEQAVEAFTPTQTAYQYLRDFSRMTREQIYDRLEEVADFRPGATDYPDQDDLVRTAAEIAFYAADGVVTDWPTAENEVEMLAMIRGQDLHKGIAERRFSIFSRDVSEIVAESNVPFSFFLGMDEIGDWDRFDIEQLEPGIRLWIERGDGAYTISRV